MAHPQGTNRGLLAKGALMCGSAGLFSVNYSEGTAILTANSTGEVNMPGKLTLGSNVVIGSTGIILAANSTGLTIQVGTAAAAQISTAS